MIPRPILIIVILAVLVILVNLFVYNNGIWNSVSRHLKYSTGGAERAISSSASSSFTPEFQSFVAELVLNSVNELTKDVRDACAEIELTQVLDIKDVSHSLVMDAQTREMKVLPSGALDLLISAQQRKFSRNFVSDNDEDRSRDAFLIGGSVVPKRGGASETFTFEVTALKFHAPIFCPQKFEVVSKNESNAKNNKVGVVSDNNNYENKINNEIKINNDNKINNEDNSNKINNEDNSNKINNNEDNNNPTQLFWLAIHTSSDKLDNIRMIADRWPGPIALAVLKKGDTIESATQQLVKYRNLKITWVDNSNGVNYPVNKLRQAAMDIVPDNVFMLPLDVDFIPSENLYSSVTRKLDYFKKKGDSTVFVVPAFEVDEGFDPPKTFNDLMQCRSSQHCRGVLESAYEWAHRATNYGKWYDSSESSDPFEIDWEWTFEPYIFGLKRCLPPYHQGFQYYGNDKVSWIYHVAAWGARWEVLPQVFVTHKNHPKNQWSQDERNRYRDEVVNLFNQFQYDVKSSIAPQGCHGTKDNKLLK